METGTSYPTGVYRYSSPDGTVWIKIAKKDKDVWVDVSVGKNATSENSNAHALGVLTGVALRSGVHWTTLVKYLREITVEDSSVIGYEAKSIADALGRALQEEYEEGGKL